MLPRRDFQLIVNPVYIGYYNTYPGQYAWEAVCLPVDASLVAGMDEAALAKIPYLLSFVEDTHDPLLTTQTLKHGVRGGVWPALYWTGIGYHTYNPHTELPASDDAIFMAWTTPGATYLNKHQVDFHNLGAFFRTYTMNTSGLTPQDPLIKLQIGCPTVKVYYFNPVVNAFSHYALRIGEQVDFVIAGLGFNQVNAEINEGSYASPPDWKSYVDEIEFFHTQTTGGDWEDDFEDPARDPAWSDDPNNGTIDEVEGELMLAVGNGINGRFWSTAKNAPICWVTPGQEKVTVITKLNSYTVNDNTRAGIYITDIVDGTHGIFFGRAKSAAWPWDGIQVMEMNAGAPAAYELMTTLPVWLKVEIEGSGAGSRMVFKYSINGTDWTNFCLQIGRTWDKIGLFASNWSLFKAISAPFEFFNYSWEPPPDFTLKEADGDFTRVSDAQITIPKAKFPELSMGTYRLRLRKMQLPILSSFAEGWAGAWRPDETGLCIAGAPFEIQVGLMPTIGIRGKAKALPLACLTWKNKKGETYKDCIAPIDIRTPETFYDGRIIDISSVTRGIDHRTGLFRVSDATVRLVNTDKKYSKLLANWFLKNQPLDLWYATGFEPEDSKIPIIGMIVEDYHLQGTEFIIRMKDITQKYFKKKIPPRVCTKLTFPQIHPDEIGKPFPEVLGLCVLGTEFEHPGAVRAIYIDTLVCEYLAANGTLNSVTHVYSDGLLKTLTTDYTIIHRDGCTFIDFVEDQEDKKITFNAQGYAVDGLNSANGYIQNPAYIIFYYLNNILEVPAELLNAATFDTLASKYDDLGVGESGKLIIQKRQDSMEVLRQLLFTCGAHGFTANDGRFMLERKDIYNYETKTFLFDQIDLMAPAMREFNLTQAINTVKARWDYIPWQRLFKDAKEDYKDNKFEADMEDDIKMPREREEPPLE